MILETFLKGIILGFSIAAPLGPIGILCIQKTLNYGKLYGFTTAFGAATADAIYGFIAAFGITVIMNYFLDNSIIFQGIGSLFLIYLGVTTYYKVSDVNFENEFKKENLISTYLTTFFLTATNPMTIIFFTLLFSSISIPKQDYFLSSVLVFGVFTGSIIWGAFLTVFTGLFREKGLKYIKYVNKISGIVLIIFSVLIISSTIKTVF